VKDKRQPLPALPFVSAMASAIVLTACDNPNKGWTASEPTRTCVDQRGRRLLDDTCRGRSGFVAGPRWYYHPSGGHIPPVGDRVAGGSFAPNAGVDYRGAQVVRGGFGGRGAAAGA